MEMIPSEKIDSLALRRIVSISSCPTGRRDGGVRCHANED